MLLWVSTGAGLTSSLYRMVLETVASGLQDPPVWTISSFGVPIAC